MCSQVALQSKVIQSQKCRKFARKSPTTQKMYPRLLLSVSLKFQEWNLQSPCVQLCDVAPLFSRSLEVDVLVPKRMRLVVSADIVQGSFKKPAQGRQVSAG